MSFFGFSVSFPRTSFCDARYERSGWSDSQISACSARYAENPKKSSLALSMRMRIRAVCFGDVKADVRLPAAKLRRMKQACCRKEAP